MRRFQLGVLACLIAVPAALHPAAAQQTATRHIALGNANLLRVNVSGDLTLVPDANASDILIVGSAPVGSPPLRVESTRTGRRLNVALSGPARSPLPFTASGHSYRLTYPAGLRIDVREFAGGVTIAHSRAPIVIYNANGPIAIADAAGSVTVEADNGSIRATGVRAPISATTGTGDLRVVLERGWRGREVRLESSNGNVSLAVPPGFRGHYDLSSGNGAVSNPLPSDPHGALVFILTERGNVAVTRENL